jgi:hypothetical protein
MQKLILRIHFIWTVEHASCSLDQESCGVALYKSYGRQRGYRHYSEDGGVGRSTPLLAIHDKFTAVIRRDQVLKPQFHPQISHDDPSGHCLE